MEFDDRMTDETKQASLVSCQLTSSVLLNEDIQLIRQQLALMDAEQN